MKHFTFIIFSLYSIFTFSTEVKLTQDKWRILEYKKIKPNHVKFENKKLILEVNNSASPLIYPFSKTRNLTHLDIEVDVLGTLKLRKDKQGSSGNDDFRFRIGVVYAGDKTLNAFERMVAPKWINTLYKLAPKGKGIDHIHFFNSWQDTNIKGQSRTHYASDLLKESFILKIVNNKIKERIELDPAKEVAALWISCDGDDTESKFKVIINKIKMGDK